MDRIDCLRAFVRTMESGSFSAAARELGIGQSTVSKRIALLEREFGSQLFMRTTRRMRPTPEAHRIWDLAREVMNTFDLAHSSLQESAPEPSGTLRISVAPSFGRHYAMPIVAEYRRICPQVHLDIRFSDCITDLVEQGIELALHIGPVNSTSLIARRIALVRRYLVATPKYLRDAPMLGTPGDLRHHRCICDTRLKPANQWAFESEFGRHVVDVVGVVTLDDDEAASEAVLDGLGIAMLPAWSVARLVDSGRVEVLLPDYSLPVEPLLVVYPETKWMSQRARQFFELLDARAGTFVDRISAAGTQPVPA